MKAQKQLFRHDPANGVYGDCFRTAIACVLNLDAAEVPHFMDGTPGKGEAEAANDAAERWLNEIGLHMINVLYPGELRPEQVMEVVSNQNYRVTGLVFMLSGTSRTGVNHAVVCCGGKIVCDPSLDDAGIVGPSDDGYYWVTFFGSMKALHTSSAEAAA